MILDTAILIALYGLLPLLIGAAATGLVRVRGSRLAASYVAGYALLLAVFCVVALHSAQDGDPYETLYHLWPIVCIFLASGSVIIFVLGTLLHRAAAYRQTASDIHLPPPTKRTRVLLIISICLIVFSVLLLVPGARDDTPELARLTLQTKSFFPADPTTGEAFAQSSARPGMIHLFYAVGASLSGMDPTRMLHWVMPVFMIPLYICAYCRIAWVLFPHGEDARRRFRCVILIILFFLIMTATTAHIGITPLNNSWNGVTLAASCLLPLFFAQCLRMIALLTDTGLTRIKPEVREKSAVIQLISGVAYLIVLAAAAALCVPTGWILCAIQAFATVLTVIGLRVYDRKRGGRS